MNEPSIIPAIRDLSIIFLALESIVVLVLLSILIVQIRALVILLNDEIKPMLEATQETADTVRNTTNFVSKRVARPFVSAISFGAGVRQAVKTVKQQVVPSKNEQDESSVTEPSMSEPSDHIAPEPPASTPDTDMSSGADNG